MARKFEMDSWTRSLPTFSVILFSLLVSSNYVSAKTVVKYISESEPCVCVIFTQCDDNGMFDRNGTIGISPRGGLHLDVQPTTTPQPAPICEENGYVCCRIRQDEIPEFTSVDEQPPDNSMPQTMPNEPTETPPLIFPVTVPNPPRCGVQHTPLYPTGYTPQDSRSFAHYGQFPWMLLILSEEPDSGILTVQCGAALITAQFAITTAHCVDGKDPNNLVVRAGEWDIRSDVELVAPEERNVQKIITHPSFLRDPIYKKGPLHNDIAILVLDEKLFPSDNIDTICLPVENKVFDGSRCIATGWGKVPAGNNSDVLRKVELPIVPRMPCQTRLRKTRVGKVFNLHDSFLCAGGERGRDICEGNGGSPLVCPGDTVGGWELAGLLSWGVGCGSSAPSVFVNVSKYTLWIVSEWQNFMEEIAVRPSPRQYIFMRNLTTDKTNSGGTTGPHLGLVFVLLLSLIYSRLREHRFD